MNTFFIKMNTRLNIESTLDFRIITVGENIIATIKIRNNYGAIQSFIFPILQ